MRLNHLAGALDEAVAITFFDMAFMEVIPAPEITPNPAGQPGEKGYCVGITGSIPGPLELLICLPEELYAKISTNIFIGNEMRQNLPVIHDCLRELVNVLAGHFFGKIAETDGDYTLSLPRIVKKFPAAGERNGYSYNAEGTPFSIWLINQ